MTDALVPVVDPIWGGDDMLRDMDLGFIIGSCQTLDNSSVSSESRPRLFLPDDSSSDLILGYYRFIESHWVRSRPR